MLICMCISLYIYIIAYS